MRWSITDSPAKPASSAARATPVSQASGSSPQGNRLTWSTTLRPCDVRRSSPAGAVSGATARSAGSSARTVCTTSQPSSSSCGTTARCRLSWPTRADAGTGRSRAELRRRHSASGVSITTATAGSPTSRARASQRRRRSSSVPSVSMTVVSPRPRAGGHHTLQQVERVRGRVEVVRAAADHAAQGVGGDDLVVAVAALRPRGLPRARRADEDDERRVGKRHHSDYGRTRPDLGRAGAWRWQLRAGGALGPGGAGGLRRRPGRADVAGHGGR